jgi:arylsulfatase A-like enzyme
MNRIFIWPVILPVLFLSCTSMEEDRPPNIIYILADDLGYGDVECFNPGSKIPTPFLNEMAVRGISFTAAHAPASVCTPTRYSFLTGRYPWRSAMKSGVSWIWDPPILEPERLTIAEMLKDHGYHTACIGKWHLGWDWPTSDGKPASVQNDGSTVDYTRRILNGPMAHGFDYYFGDDVPGFPPHAFIENDRLTELPSDFHESPPGASGAMSPDWTYEALLPTLTKKAVHYILDRIKEHADKPFFLYLSLNAPHTPIAPADEFLGSSYAGKYGDFVVQLDRTVGEILETVSKLGIEEQTLILFTSDNGPTTQDGEAYQGRLGSIYEYDHDPAGGLRGIKSDAWEGGHRVPFIATWKDHIPEGIVTDKLLSHTDMMATFAALAGIKLPDNTAEDSHNLLRSLLGQNNATARKVLISQSGNGILSIQKGEWKLIMSSGSGGSLGSPAGEPAIYLADEGEGKLKNVQLYNLEKDLAESENLAEEMPDRVNELASLLARHILDGRSTPGKPDVLDTSDLWEEVGWLLSMDN